MSILGNEGLKKSKAWKQHERQVGEPAAQRKMQFYNLPGQFVSGEEVTQLKARGIVRV